METIYKHHLYPRQSMYVKYRGKSGQIDIKDTVIGILSKHPGYNLEAIADLIFHPTLKKSIFYSLPRTLELLEEEGVIVREESEDRYYLYNDAMSHDIGKTKAMMDALLHRGLTPEHVTFLSSGVLMASEQAKSESLNRNYHTSESAASSMVDKDTQPIEPVKVEPWMEVPKNLEFDALDTPNPFVNMSPIEDISLKLQVKADIIKEETEAKLAKKEAEFKQAIEEHIETQKTVDVEPEKTRIIPNVPIEDRIKLTEGVEYKQRETKSFFGWLKSMFKKD